jgi:ankyrin repeat protein
MNLPDKFGYTPLHYTAMYSKTYSFIFLYCKLGLKFIPQVMQPTLMQMSTSQECMEIVEILLHTPEWKPYIMAVVLPTAL